VGLIKSWKKILAGLAVLFVLIFNELHNELSENSEKDAPMNF